MNSCLPFPDIIPEIRERYSRVVDRLLGLSEQCFHQSVPPTLIPEHVIRRPFSILVKCRVQLKTSDYGIYIKFANLNGENELQMKKRLFKEVDVTRKLYEVFPEGCSGSVPKVLAFFPEEMSIVTRESAGEQFRQVIARSARGNPPIKVMRRLEQYCRSVGTWLKSFQKTLPVDVEHQEMPQDLVEYVDIRLNRLMEGGYLQTGDRKEILGYIQRKLNAGASDESPHCPAHGDLSLSNILIGAGHVTVLDFAMYRQDSHYLDPSYFFQQLDNFLVSPFFRPSTLAVLKEAFLNAYAQGFDACQPIFAAYRVRHMVNRLDGLSVMHGLSPIKRWYQRWQYGRSFSNLRRFMSENG